MFALTNCTIYTGFEVWRDRALVIVGQRVQAIAPAADLPAACESIDLGGGNRGTGIHRPATEWVWWRDV